MFILKLTCGECPEQYDVFLAKDHGNHRAGDQVGYFQARHGCFTADYPDCGGRGVYDACIWGDGKFDDGERYFHLNRACEALRDAVEGKMPSREVGELLFEIEGKAGEAFARLHAKANESNSESPV
jgi:hypothetical protein